MSSHVTPAGQLVIYRTDEHELEDSFERFDRENPHVYRELVRLAKRWRLRRGAGATCSIKMLYEVARWELGLRSTGEPLHLNNNYHAFYARKMMRCEPGLAGIFKTRRQRSEAE